MLNTDTPLSSLPYMPLDPAWIEQSLAFRHADPRMAAAYMRVLLAAWRGQPAATIPHSIEYIAQTTGLSREMVAQNLQTLTEGFSFGDNERLQHDQMAKLAVQIISRYGDAVREYALSAAMAVQAPGEFGLVAVESAKAKSGASRLLPRGFGFAMHPDLADWLEQNGYPTPQDREYILSKFIDYANGKGLRSPDWPAAARTYAAQEISFGRMPPSRKGSGVVRAGGLRSTLSKGQVAADHNIGLFASRPPVSATGSQGARRTSGARE